MHKDHKALFRLTIKKAEENLHRIDEMRDDLRDMDRKLVLMENAISQSINDLRHPLRQSGLDISSRHA